MARQFTESVIDIISLLRRLVLRVRVLCLCFVDYLKQRELQDKKWTLHDCFVVAFAVLTSSPTDNRWPRSWSRLASVLSLFFFFIHRLKDDPTFAIGCFAASKRTLPKCERKRLYKCAYCFMTLLTRHPDVKDPQKMSFLQKCTIDVFFFSCMYILGRTFVTANEHL